LRLVDLHDRGEKHDDGGDQNPRLEVFAVHGGYSFWPTLAEGATVVEGRALSPHDMRSRMAGNRRGDLQLSLAKLRSAPAH
jgi:hypothetical protein